MESSNRCQAEGCGSPAAIRIKTVGLCSEHMEKVTARVPSLISSEDGLTADAVLALLPGKTQRQLRD